MISKINNIEDQKLDNTINLISDGVYQADNTVFKSEFYEELNKVVYESNGRSVTWTPVSIKYVDEIGIEDEIYSVQEVPLEVKANYARYNRAFPDIDDWFIQENDRLKHQILVQGFQRDPMPWLEGQIDFVISGMIKFDEDLEVWTNGLNVTGDFHAEGDIYLKDKDGNIVFTLPQIVAYDSRIPERSRITGKYKASFNNAGELYFDIVIDNSWISDLDRIYPLVIDPTVVGSTSTNTDYGPQQQTLLDNGWMITVIESSSSTSYVYVSKDNGASWQQICFSTNGNTGLTTWGSAVASAGNIVYLFITKGAIVRYLKIDPTTVTNTDQVGNHVYVDSSASGSGYPVAVIQNGKVYFAYCYYYSSIFNVRYVEGTLNGDGTITWGAIDSVTANAAGCVKLGLAIKDGNPYITCVYNAAMVLVLSKSITVHERTTLGGNATSTGTWGNKVLFSFLAPGTPNQTAGSFIYIPSNICGKTNGRFIYCVLDDTGTDEDPVIAAAIKFVISDDSFATITVVNKTPEVTTIKQATLTALVSGRTYLIQGYTSIYKSESTDFGDTWGAAITGATGLPSSCRPTVYHDPNFRAAILSYVYLNSSLYCEFALTNAAPNAPSGLVRTNFDATKDASFMWTFSDSDSNDHQTAYQVQIIRVSDGTVVKDTGKVVSTSSSYLLPANTLVNGVQYQWKVRVYDKFDTVSVYSSLATFKTALPPVTTISSPLNSEIIAGSILTVEWTVSDPNNYGQSAYQVVLTSNIGDILYDSGKVSSVSSRSLTLPFTLINNIGYKIRVKTWNSQDVDSSYAENSFTANFTLPAIPSVSLVVDKTKGSIIVNMVNPAPTGLQPTVSHNDLYRKEENGYWKRIAGNLNVNSLYEDFNIASGISYDYKIVAYGDNTTSIESNVDSSKVNLKGVLLHDVLNPSGTIHKFMYSGQERSYNWQAEATFMQFAGRKKKVVEFGESEDEKVTAKIQMSQKDNDYDALSSLIKSNRTLCYRDSRGRKVFGVITSLPIIDEFYGCVTTIEVTAIDYSEEV